MIMVNTGKPSRGCYMCRARRIKCDEGKPSCMRCEKSKRICPGYRDLFELKLRDETKSTTQKLSGLHSHGRNESLDSLTSENDYHHYGSYGRLNKNSQARGQTTALSPSVSQPDWIDYDNFPWGDESPTKSRNEIDDRQPQGSRRKLLSRGWSLDQPAIVRQPLGTPLDQQAACFFLQNYVLIPSNDSMTQRGHLHWLLPLLKDQPANSPLTMTFASVGLATLAVRPNSKRLMPMASSCYIKALKHINLSLKDPIAAKSDATLATILLLVVFEQITSSSLDMSGYASHINGAVAILKTRGKRGLGTSLGRELFIAVRELMTIQYMAKSLPVDPSVDWWINEVNLDKREEPLTQSYARFNLLTASLRQDTDITTSLAPQIPTNIEAVLALLRRAQDLEHEHREWFNNAPIHWKHDPIAWIDWSSLGLEPGEDLSTSVVHPGRVDAYNGTSVAYANNVSRSSHILIWTSIIRCVAWLKPDSDYRISPEYKKAAEICTELIDEIVSSVPYFFGWNAHTDLKTAMRHDRSMDHDIKGASGMFLMWPMYVASSSDFCSDSQRQYLRGRLQFISEIMGIRQAKMLLSVPLRHPCILIMQDKMKMKMHSSQSLNQTPSLTSSNASASQSHTSPTISEASRKMSNASSAGRRA